MSHMDDQASTESGNAPEADILWPFYEEPWEEYRRLLFDVRRSARYSEYRRRHYDRLHAFLRSTALISGSATVTATAGAFGRWAVGCLAAAGAFAGAIDLTLKPSEQARQQQELRRRFFELEQSMLTEPINRESIRKWWALRRAIEMDEPPVLRVLSAICHNEQVEADGLDTGAVELTPIQRMLAQFVDWGWKPEELRPAATSSSRGWGSLEPEPAVETASEVPTDVVSEPAL